MSSQTEIFRRRVRDSLGEPPASASLNIALREAIDRFAQTPISALVLLDENRRPAGILTEADIVRRIALRSDLPDTAAPVMTAPVITVEADEYLYRGIARMRRHGLRHLPVVDAAGALAGMLHMDDALASASADLVARIDRLSGDDSEASLISIKAAQADIAAALLADAVPVGDVQGLITHVNNDLYRRVTRSILAETGAPPTGFAVIVMGSGGRGENFLTPDQDNGLVIADYPDADHDRIDGWFIEFAERLTGRIDRIGLPLCDGYVMATNPLWRKTQTQWGDQVDVWLRRSSAAAVLLSDIFFDFQPVAGDIALARPIRDRITGKLPQHRRFLGDMQRHHAHMRSPLGLFGRFRTERGNAAHRGAINLKSYGVQPVVSAARILALRDGIDETSTRARLLALSAAGALGAHNGDEIVNAFDVVCDLMLRSQISEARTGAAITNFIQPAALTRRQRKTLRDAFRVIDGFSDGTRAEITGQVI